MAILAATYPFACYTVGDVFVLDWGSTLAKSQRSPKEIFVENLNSYLQRHGDQKKLADAVGVSKMTITNWKTGATEPGLEELKKIADFFGTWTHMLLLDRTGVEEARAAEKERTVESEIESLRMLVTRMTKKIDELKELQDKEKTIVKAARRKA